MGGSSEYTPDPAVLADRQRRVDNAWNQANSYQSPVQFNVRSPLISALGTGAPQYIPANSYIQPSNPVPQSRRK